MLFCVRVILFVMGVLCGAATVLPELPFIARVLMFVACVDLLWTAVRPVDGGVV